MEIQDLIDHAELELRSRLPPNAALKPKQKETLAFLAAGRNVFSGLPTGYGKSVCFWLPAAAWKWKVWVISPLISLIEDQAHACTAIGLKVIAWRKGLSQGEKKALSQKMLSEGWDICFSTPERFIHWHANGFLSLLEQMGHYPDLMALDEMHCFEDWRSFRKSYQDLFSPLKKLSAKGVKVLGLSASFAKAESQAWMAEFCEEFEIVEEGLGRKNLSLIVVPFESEAERWLMLLSCLRELKAPESAIIYFSSRNGCDEAVRWLKSCGLGAVAYHAGLPAFQRANLSKGYRRGFLRIICATSAFGMGVDYPHTSRVIHFDMPFDLISYWQEAGRAGRNGAPAYAIAFWRRSEISRAMRMSDEQKKRFFQLWESWSSSDKCRKQAVAEALGKIQEKCGNCDVCCNLNQEVVPIWMQDWNFEKLKNVWWLETEAQPALWAKEKIFSKENRLTVF